MAKKLTIANMGCVTALDLCKIIQTFSKSGSSAHTDFGYIKTILRM